MSAEQKTAEWLFERVGLVTASNFRKVIARLKNGSYAKERDDYLWQTVIEQLTGQPTDHFTNAAMQYGTDSEPFARMAYEAATGAMVDEVGLIKHPTIEGVAGSPDGLIGDDGGLEIKCPFNSAVHLRTWLDGMPPEHAGQVQGLMWVTGRKWWDFVSYDARVSLHLQLYVERIARDDDYIAKMEPEVKAFIGEVNALVMRFSEMATKEKRKGELSATEAT